ncbi:MAG: GGDEF domain-containing protein [Candidatus Bipolaricaulia bacterium]
MGEATKLLLIEDNPGDARLIRELLAEATEQPFQLIHVDSLRAGLERLHGDNIGLVLTDLNLPDSRQLATFDTLHEQAPLVPIVVLTAIADDETGLAAVRRGAQDYLVKGDVDGPRLVTTLRHALERHQAQRDLLELAHIDHLTGLLNRRGFREAANQHDQLCSRSGQGYLLLFIDVNNLKSINDTAGHAAGDAALERVAEALSTTFRASDVLGRWGGDEFVVIATNVDESDTDRLVSRLLDNTKQICYHEKVTTNCR